MIIREIENGAERATWDRFVEAHPMSRTVFPMYYFADQWREMPIGMFDGDRLCAGLLAATRRFGPFPVGSSRILAVMVPGDRAAEVTAELLGGFEAVSRRRLLVETEVQ